MPTISVGCQKTPPPKRELSEISREMPEKCPDGLVCYTEGDHAVIEKGLFYQVKLERWAKLTWIACKPSEIEKE